MLQRAREDNREGCGRLICARAICCGSTFVLVCVNNHGDCALVGFANGLQGIYISPRPLFLHPIAVFIDAVEPFILPFLHQRCELFWVCAYVVDSSVANGGVMFFVAVLDNGEAVEQAVAIGGGADKALVVLAEVACERLVGHMGSLGW